jgi:hypothetical protein
VSTVDPAHLRDKSQVAFGQRYRLELMLAVAASDDGIVCLTDLARQLDVSISNLQGPLRAMISAGLLTPLPRGDSQRKFYIRNPSAGWTWAHELHTQTVLENTVSNDNDLATDT